MPGSRTTAGSAAAPLAERPPDPAPRERPASYPSAATSSTAASATRPPAYGMPATATPPAALERPSTVFERFADHGPSRMAAAADHRHKIVDGDTLASIARRHLGAEDRFLDLFEHNRDVLVTPELLPIGKELRIPPPDYVRPRDPPIESNSSSLTAVSAPQSRVVQSSSRPAVQTPQSPNASPFADGSRLLQGSVPDGSPGRQVLQTTESPSASGGLPPQTYVVQAHDTLGLIARKVYGDINRQSELIDANRQQLRSPQDLRPGMKLVVPGGRKP